MKRLIATFLSLILLTVLIVACGGSASSGGGSSSSSGSGSSSSSGGGGTVTVDAKGTNFVQPWVTLTKGSSLKITDDDSTPHIIKNGTWDNGTAKTLTESGAPTVNVTLNGNDSQTVGPFNTAGTFHLYCTVHPNMNLTVTVQ